MPVRIAASREKCHRCPCCNSKTLRCRGQDEICPVCFWHDDGQDEAEADEIWGGPNKGPSLREARVNFSTIAAVDEGVRSFVRELFPEER